MQRRAARLLYLLLSLALIGVSTLVFRQYFPGILTEGAPTPSPTTSSFDPHPILADPRVRQAIAHCTNRSELIRSVYPWLEDTTPFEMHTFLPATHWAYPQDDSSLISYPFDPKRGASLLEQAGWTLAKGAAYRTNASGQELSLTLTYTSSELRDAWTAIFEEQMRSCGIRIVHNRVLYEERNLVMKQHQFDITAYPRYSFTDPNGQTLFRCDQIPSPENAWQGDNYAGWCNPIADQATRLATGSLSREVQRDAYRTIQEEYLRDLPGLPLFSRLEIYASHPTLTQFNPDTTEEIYTWNIADWAIPGRDAIVIAQRSEPTSLFIPFDDAYVTRLIGAILNGVDYTNLGYDYQPVLLKQIPTLESGNARVEVVQVSEGEQIVDVDGNVVSLQPGTTILDAQGDEIIYHDGTASMSQLVVKYEFVDGLTWSDGKTVSKDDYELAYRILCDPEIINAEIPLFESLVCPKIQKVDFISDTAYIVTWMPGYTGRDRADRVGQPYFLPPIGRLPSQMILSDGRRLNDVPVADWRSLPEVNRQLPGVGAYIVSQWVPGKEIVFTANPYYYQGVPATPRIILRFLSGKEAVEALLRGEVDVVDADTIQQLDKVDKLLQALSEGKVRLHFVPSFYYELLTFSLVTR